MPTLINGVAVVWSDIQIPFLGVPLTGVTAISWSEKQEKTNNYGIGNKPVSRGYGRIAYEGSITLLAEEWRNIIAAAPLGSINKIPFFDLPILFVSPLTGLQMKVTLKAVDFTDASFDSKEGDTMIPITMPFIFADIETIVI
jgi:hypothetical protein